MLLDSDMDHQIPQKKATFNLPTTCTIGLDFNPHIFPKNIFMYLNAPIYQLQMFIETNFEESWWGGGGRGDFKLIWEGGGGNKFIGNWHKRKKSQEVSIVALPMALG